MAKILLVEDDNNLREIYEARLQAEGYDIVSARDGEEALVVAKTEKPDLVISDVMMPKISGFEMLDILRNTEGLKDVKVVMLTALGQTEDQQRANKLGADRYLVKSQVTLEDIVKAAHDLLGDAEAATTAKDDKLMNDAVNSLVSDTSDSDTATKPAPAASVEPASSTVPSATDTGANADSNDDDSDSSSSQVPVAHKKVIHPIDTGPEKDIQTLLAEEEAREAKQVAGDSTAASQAIQPAPPAPEAPAAAPTPAPEITNNEAGNEAASTAKEEAAIDAKIEDFVAGASSEPTPPLAQPPTQPAPEPATPVSVTMPQPATPTPAPTTAPPVPSASPVTPPPAPQQPVPAPTPLQAPSAPSTPRAPAPKPDNQNPSSPPPDPNIIAL